MISDSFPELQNLTPDQKIILAAELCREALDDTNETPDPKLIQALRERLEYHKAHPLEVSTWDEVKARIINR